MAQTTSPTEAERLARAQRFAAALDTRRDHLGMSLAEVAQAAGMTEQNLRNIRRGKTTPRPRTRRAIEAAVAWEPGSIDTVMDGGDPTIRPARAADVGPAAEFHAVPRADGFTDHVMIAVIAGIPVTVHVPQVPGRDPEDLKRALVQSVTHLKEELGDA
ncbi:helix-turn-helix domain-containing protein [Marinactinospora rubrisoli]|uniref:Helix-turn-helix domain-containing protein n=1 Tax=Marinactinospora rubrisoli TaxID=2715399 RepID=A0ABW2KEZ3_9ACTN